MIIWGHLLLQEVWITVLLSVPADLRTSRMDTNMHEACLQIDKECRLGEKLFDLFSFYFFVFQACVDV